VTPTIRWNKGGKFSPRLGTTTKGSSRKYFSGTKFCFDVSVELARPQIVTILALRHSSQLWRFRGSTTNATPLSLPCRALRFPLWFSLQPQRIFIISTCSLKPRIRFWKIVILLLQLACKSSFYSCPELLIICF
jgi:hypothetical protein